MTCTHHWQIAAPHGATSRGVCKYCGEAREFANVSAQDAWGGEEGRTQRSHAGKARAGAATTINQLAR